MEYWSFLVDLQILGITQPWTKLIPNNACTERFCSSWFKKNLIFLVLNLDMYFSRLLRKDKKRFHDSLSFI